MTMPATMRALQLRRIDGLEEVELPVPHPETDEILVRTRATTICTSDLNDIHCNPFDAKLPRVLGHEGAGAVAAVGDQVRGFAVGDHVAAHPVVPCGRCESCRRGFRHLCDHMGHLGLDRDGTFAEYFAIRADRARVLPDSVDASVGALLEPVAVCLEAVHRASIGPRDGVLVVGDGPFGIIISRLCLQQHPRCAILVGHHDFRLNQVPEFTQLNAKRLPDLPAAVLEASGGQGVDVAIAAAGTPESARLCLDSLRPRGRVVVFASISEPVPVDLFRLQFRELAILGSCNDDELVDEALGHLSDPRLRLDSLITHRVPFPEWRRALALASERKEGALKVAITFEGGPQ